MQRIFLLFLLLLAGNFASGQATEDLTVELTATTVVSPPSITLHWKPVGFGTPTYTIYKKSKTATTFGSPIALLPAGSIAYGDAAVIVDSAYEYQVIATGSSLVSTGYIIAAIKSPPIHNKGTLIMLVDSTFTDSCAAALQVLMQDISGDGWQLRRHDISRSLPDTNVKDIIISDYATLPNVKAVLILGHIAVPYSGDFDTVTYYPPDGHVPYHDGAWPADIWYSCMSGWTDVSVNNTLGSYSANWNTPGDGKWDQVPIPSAGLLQIGRVDFWNMPAFSATEVQLMNSYLAKDHSYKMDSLTMRHRAILHDDFGYFGGEGFAANGWRNFSPIVTNDSLTVVAPGQLITTINADTYQWAYGCGGGSFTGAGGIGATTDFAANAGNSIFMMLFGSYFGDWNVQNNFLRAPLCANPPFLTNCWAGRPNWFFHHMALGENIGYGALLSQNNDGTLYQPGNYGAGYIHAALMGDLTLRTDYIQPISHLTITAPVHSGATLNWTASPDPAVLGYYVYRADSAFGYFKLISSLLTTTTFHDVNGHNGLKYYMVRPVKLQPTPSGSYNNLGIGVTDTAHVSFASSLQIAGIMPRLSVNVFPNPTSNYLNVTVNASDPVAASLTIINEAGQQMSRTTKMLNAGANTYSQNVSKYASGVYNLVLRSGDQEVVTKWVKL